MEDINYVIPLEDVLEAYYSCRKNKRNTINAIEFEVDYETKCVELWRDINEKNYEIGKSIAFVVTQPKHREVFAANFRDRIVHHIITSRLEPLFEEVFIEDTYNCRKGKGTLYGVKRLHQKIDKISEHYTKDCYIAKFDIKGFFMSIHKPTLWNMLKEFIEDKYHKTDKELLLWLVEKVVKHCPEKNCIVKGNKKLWDNIDKDKSLFTNGDDYGLPIGNLTSQMFANFYLHKFDVLMKDKFDGYGRYVDDFYIVDKDKSKILSSVKKIERWMLDKLGIKLHENKRYIQYYLKGCKFIGSVVKGRKLYVGNYTKSRFIDKVKFFNNRNNLEYIKNHFINFMSSINSYLGFMKHYLSYSIKRNIICMICSEWWDVFYTKSDFSKIILKNKYKQLEYGKNIWT